MTDIDIEIDLPSAARQAETAKALLASLRARHDLRPYEYTSRVRIAPNALPFSHPILTLNTQLVYDEIGFLRLYLHEQLHWYATWFANKHPDRWESVLHELDGRYPEAPVGFPNGAQDRASTILHLVVNWLELQAISALLGEDPAVAHLQDRSFVYRWCYRVVLEDRTSLEALYRRNGLSPIKPADTFSDLDFKLAAHTSD